MKKVVISALMLLGSPSVCWATPLSYAASGSALDTRGHALSVSGTMLIDDALRDWRTGLSVEGNSRRIGIEESGMGEYQYSIQGFDLTVGENRFWGNTGELYLSLWYDPALAPSAHGIGDNMWFLEDGHGAWTDCIGELFYFRNADGSLREPAQYIALPPLIELTEYDYGQSSNLSRCQIFLTQQETPAPPAPEPATMFLVGTGLAGFAATRRRSKKHLPEK